WRNLTKPVERLAQSTVCETIETGTKGPKGWIVHPKLLSLSPAQFSFMEPHKLSCEEARKIDLVDYLAHLGHYPRRIRQNEYWYISPLRDEKTASFKVNRKLNLWFDHGMGKGGNTVDFGISYHRCPIPE